MKTAMQELMQWLDDSIPETIKEKYLEKEKYQIQKSYKDHHDLGHIYGLDTEQYYNQTYNQQEDKTFKQKSKWTTQKQHIIDIMKADEDDVLYNQNK